MSQTAARVPLEEAVVPFLHRWGRYRVTRDEVSLTAIRRFCEVARDANPVYWDEALAGRSRFGRIVAPSQALFSMSWQGESWWEPAYVTAQREADAQKLTNGDEIDPSAVNELLQAHGYTNPIVVGQRMEYVSQFGPGDGRLRIRSMTTEVSGEKQTSLGRGVFVTSVSEISAEGDGRVLGFQKWTNLRYNPEFPRAKGVGKEL